LKNAAGIETNAPIESEPVLKHLYRLSNFIRTLSGVVLDIGSDQPSHSSKIFPKNCRYLGLDPYAGEGEFRVIGMGEILPICNESVDVVMFNTSMDHILDHHTAIEEAHRVLKPGGSIIITGYAWLFRGSLLNDSQHFHHFREYEYSGALQPFFDIVDIERYEDVKKSDHRFNIYIAAQKNF